MSTTQGLPLVMTVARPIQIGFGWYWGASGKSLSTQHEIVPLAEIQSPPGVLVYFIGEDDFSPRTLHTTSQRCWCIASGGLKRWLKRLGITLAVPLTILTGFVVVEHVRGKWMLSDRLKVLEARGERLTVAALEPERPLSGENAFEAILARSNSLNTVSGTMPLPPSMEFQVPGKALVTAKLDEWAGEGGEQIHWDPVFDYLEGMNETIALLRLAADLPAYDSGFDYKKGFVDFQLAQVADVKNAITLLSAAVLSDLRRDDLAAAQANLIALTRLSVNQTPEPLLILQLIRQACVAIAFNTSWQALQSSEWTDEQLATLQRAWVPCDLIGDMAWAMEMERAMTLDLYRQCRESYGTLQDVVAQQAEPAWVELTGELPTRGFWLNWVHLPVYRAAWINQDALRGLERWQYIIERERWARTNSWLALADGSAGSQDSESVSIMALFEDGEELGCYDRLRYLLSSDPFAITDLMVRRTFLFQAQQQMVLTAIALQRHHLRHGTYPGSLEQLMPEMLSEEPKDWMDGKSLRYNARADGGFLLYSVGEDGVDDGGDPNPSDPEVTYRQLRHGRDLVWPVAVTETETGPSN